MIFAHTRRSTVEAAHSWPDPRLRNTRRDGRVALPTEGGRRSVSFRQACVKRARPGSYLWDCKGGLARGGEGCGGSGGGGAAVRAVAEGERWKGIADPGRALERGREGCAQARRVRDRTYAAPELRG